MTLAVDDKQPIVQLPGYSLLKITGEDALEFLSNQFTNNLKSLKNGFTSLSTWCSPKGRVLYSFRIWKENDIFYLLMPGNSDLDTFLKRLRMFVLRSKVQIDPVENAECFGLICNNCAERLHDLPDEVNSFTRRENQTVIRLPGTVKRYQIIITTKPNFEHTNDPAARALWYRHDIVAGLPEITTATSDDFLPQMLDMEHLGGLSFQKGCYPGQEIVARVKYRGELKKQLYKAVIQSEHELSPGMELISSVEDKPATIGTLINVAEFGQNRYLVLAVLTISQAGNDDIRLKSDPESSLSLFDK